MSTNPSTEHDTFNTLTEGKATVLFSKEEAEAFYNPVQELNRDLSISIISKYLLSESLKHKEKGREYHPQVVEALAASGLRSVRYALELPNTLDFTVIANDISPSAVSAIKRNAEYNKATRLIAKESDAVSLLYELSKEKQKADVIDLDPYGAPSIFLDSAFAGINDGGLLAVTCTDMACLAGTHASACYAKYGSMPWHSSCGHEAGLRIALESLAERAAVHKKIIIPLLCFHIDFYVRMFVRVESSVKKAGAHGLTSSYVFTCGSCESFYLNPVSEVNEKNGNIRACRLNLESVKCKHCNSPLHINGPMWSNDYCDQTFVKELLEMYQTDDTLHTNSRRRILALLQLLSEELPNTPFFYALDNSAHFFKMHVPSHSIFSQALKSVGYDVSLSHTYPNSIKTNAPQEVVWDLFRSFNEQNPSKISETTTAYKMLKAERKTIFDLTKFKKIKEKRPNPIFVEKPSKNWGPGCKKKKTLTQNINKLATHSTHSSQDLSE
ncbi:tRNA (guanine(26)-N(2))-dimethyltransferase [Entamoeba marina]